MASTEDNKTTADTKDGDDVERRRGILKHRSEDKHHSGVQWDEMNIMMTYHPPDKDYGHMKINEPPTPYNKFKDPDEEGGEGPSVDPLSEDENDVLDPGKLSKKMVSVSRRKSWEEPPPDDDDDDDDAEADMTEEEKEKHREFKKHRTEHYNEFSKVKLARKLIEEELKALEDEEDEENKETTTDSTMEQE